MKDKIVVNGVEVGLSTDFVSLLKKQLLHGDILSGRYDEFPEPGVRSVFQAAQGTRLEPRVVEALLTLLTDPNPRVRAGAVEVIQHFSDKFDAAQLLSILENNSSLFIDVAQAAPG